MGKDVMDGCSIGSTGASIERVPEDTAVEVVDRWEYVPQPGEPPEGTWVVDAQGDAWQRYESGWDCAIHVTDEHEAEYRDRPWYVVLNEFGPLTRLVRADASSSYGPGEVGNALADVAQAFGLGIGKPRAAAQPREVVTHAQILIEKGDALSEIARALGIVGSPDVVVAAVLELIRERTLSQPAPESARDSIRDLDNAYGALRLAIAVELGKAGEPTDDELITGVRWLRAIANADQSESLRTLTRQRDDARRWVERLAGVPAVRDAAQTVVNATNGGARATATDALASALEKTTVRDARTGEVVTPWSAADDLETLRDAVRKALARAEGHDSHAPGAKAPVHAYARGLNELAKRCEGIRDAARPLDASEAPRLSVTEEQIRELRRRANRASTDAPAGTILNAWKRVVSLVDSEGFLSPESIVDRVAALHEVASPYSPSTHGVRHAARAVVSALAPGGGKADVLVRAIGRLETTLDLTEPTAEHPYGEHADHPEVGRAIRDLVGMWHAKAPALAWLREQAPDGGLLTLDVAVGALRRSGEFGQFGKPSEGRSEFGEVVGSLVSSINGLADGRAENVPQEANATPDDFAPVPEDETTTESED